MRLADPEWLILIPLLALAVWRFPAFRGPLRVTCLALLTLFLVRPQIRSTGHGLDLWVLADRSASAAASVEPHLSEWERILSNAKGPDDRLFLVDYAEEAALRDPTAGVDLTGGRDGTRTGLAAHYALSRMTPDRASRLLALTDGFATEPLDGLAERLLRQKVPLDYRIATEGNVRDFRLESLAAPARVQPGEPFLLEFRVAGPVSESVPFVIERDGAPLFRGSVEVKAGRGEARFTDRLTAPGGHRYAVRIDPPNDAHPGNNSAERWVEIVGGPRLLLIPGYTNDPLAAGLRAQGFAVELAPDPERLDAGRLQGARAVILNNVPATRMPRPFLRALDFFVREQGGGLLMAGGKASFACGGYFGSPIADVLPVSMELRQERRKLMTALAIAMDRSGSMSMPATGNLQKIDLADAGAARAVELLGPSDRVAVYAVDTEAHEVVPMSVVGNDAEKLGRVIRRVTSAGGGIYVHTSLRTCREALNKTKAGQRHIILFADANDALQEQGDYKTLVEGIVKDGITVSVIGLGTDHDSGAELLKNIAAWGQGRVFFTADPNELPSVFEQETVTVARAAFLDQDLAVKPMAGWAELAARPLRWLPTVDGCNLSYLRPGATAAAITGDDYAAPLVAFWQRGTGRVATVSFPLGGEYSVKVRAWSGFGDFNQTLARWLMGGTLAPGLALRSRVEGTELSAELLFDSTWESALARNPPRLVIAAPEGPGSGVSGGTGSQTLVWERMQPGLYRASASLRGGQIVRGAVQIGNTAVPFGPLQAGAGAEWEMNPARPAELAAASRESGGAERLDLSAIWKAPRRAEFNDIRRSLLAALLVLFLTDALLTRLGGTMPWPVWGEWAQWRVGTPAASASRNSSSRPSAAARASRPPQVPVQTPPTPAAPSAEPPQRAPDASKPPSPSTPPASRKERFRRAKRGEE